MRLGSGRARRGHNARSVLLRASPARAPTLHNALGKQFRVVLASTESELTDLLRRCQFDAVIVELDPQAPDEAAVTRVVRELAAPAALVVIGEPAAAGQLEADECVGAGESAEAVLRCVVGAIERRRLRRELEAAETRFRSIIERNADGIVIVDRAGRIRFVNPAAERLFGRGAAELQGEHFGVAVVNGETTEIDLVGGSGDEEVIAELRASVTTWEGAPAQLITVRDITDRKRAEERAQRLVWEQAARTQAEQAGRRWRFLAEAGAMLDSSLDADTTLQNLATLIVPRIADWCVIDLLDEQRFRRVAGVHADPAKQATLEELRQRYPPRPGGHQPSARVFASGRPELHRGLTAARVRELALEDDHAELLLRLGVRSLIAVPLRARDTCLGAITFVCGQRDFDEADAALAEEIGSRAGRALENARLYEAALAANKAKSDFLAVMSHELRTPLNAVLGYTQLMLDEVTGELQGVQRRHLERVQTSAMHLLQIIEEILVFASMEAGRTRIEPVRVTLGEVVDDIVAMAEPLVRERGLEFVLSVSHSGAELHTDALKVRQIALNLLTNAVKFTDTGTIELRVSIDEDEVVLEVSDTGTGIEPASIPLIFEPFRQAEGPLTRHAGGTGLGLTVSQRLAQMLGGGIGVQSEPGVGSTFTVRLPVDIDVGAAGRR